MSDVEIYRLCSYINKSFVTVNEKVVPLYSSLDFYNIRVMHLLEGYTLLVIPTNLTYNQAMSMFLETINVNEDD